MTFLVPIFASVGPASTPAAPSRPAAEGFGALLAVRLVGGKAHEGEGGGEQARGLGEATEGEEQPLAAAEGVPVIPVLPTGTSLLPEEAAVLLGEALVPGRGNGEAPGSEGSEASQAVRFMPREHSALPGTLGVSPAAMPVPLPEAGQESVLAPSGAARQAPDTNSAPATAAQAATVQAGSSEAGPGNTPAEGGALHGSRIEGRAGEIRPTAAPEASGALRVGGAPPVAQGRLPSALRPAAGAGDSAPHLAPTVSGATVSGNADGPPSPVPVRTGSDVAEAGSGESVPGEGTTGAGGQDEPVGSGSGSAFGRNGEQEPGHRADQKVQQGAAKHAGIDDEPSARLTRRASAAEMGEASEPADGLDESPVAGPRAGLRESDASGEASRSAPHASRRAEPASAVRPARAPADASTGAVSGDAVSGDAVSASGNATADIAGDDALRGREVFGSQAPGHEMPGDGPPAEPGSEALAPETAAGAGMSRAADGDGVPRAEGGRSAALPRWAGLLAERLGPERFGLAGEAGGWRTLTLELGEGEGTIRVRARAQDGGLALSVHLSNPEARAVAAQHADAIRARIEQHYGAPVDLAFDASSGREQGETRQEPPAERFRARPPSAAAPASTPAMLSSPPPRTRGWIG